MSNLLLYTNEVNSSKLITDLIDLQISLARSEFDIQDLYRKLNQKKFPIEEALAKYDESYSLFGVDIIKKKHIVKQMTTEQVVNLISEVDKLSREERGTIVEILQKSNNNVKIVSQLISGLSVLSNMSFDEIRKVSNKMQSMDEELDIALSSADKNSSQFKQFVYSQYNKKFAEEEKYNLLINRIESLELIPKDFMNKTFLPMKEKLEEEFTILMKHEREKFNSELNKWKFFSIMALIGGIISILTMCLFIFVI